MSAQFPVRMLLLGLAFVIAQVAAVAQIRVLGVNADVVALVVVSVGLLAGSMNGAVFGFCAGIFVDMALVQTLGISSLLLTAVGYGSGRLRELHDPQGALVPPLTGAVGTLVAVGGFALMQFLLGVDAPVSFLLLLQILAVVAVNTVVAIPVHAVVRRWLLPALPDDPRRRRRRAYTTGGLSPLSRA